MNVSTLLAEVKSLGGAIGVDEDYLVLDVPKEFPTSMIETLRKQKPEIIVYLASLKELSEVERRVYEEGYVLLRSDILDDFIAFHRDDVDLSVIPAGFVPYSENELMHLFEDENYLSGHSLRLIHKAKKLGAVIKSKRSRKDKAGEDRNMSKGGMP